MNTCIHIAGRPIGPGHPVFVVAELSGNHQQRSIRPGAGLAPRHLDRILQSRASCDISRGTPLSLDMMITPEAGVP